MIESCKSRKSRHYKNPLIRSLYSHGFLGGVDYENEFPSVEPLRNIEQEYRKEILDMQGIFNRNDPHYYSAKVHFIEYCASSKGFGAINELGLGILRGLSK